MKNTILYAIFAAVLFTACKDDVIFPDPGLDQYTPSTVILRRDTVDAYTIRFRVAANAGVESLRLLDGRTYETLTEFSQYEGQTLFDFEYTVDFSDIPATKDSTLIYTVQVRAKDNRASNKSVKIDLRKVSVPEVVFPQKIFSTGSMICVVDCKVLTGIHDIKDIKVYMDDMLVATESDPMVDVLDKKTGEIIGQEPAREYIARYSWVHNYVPYAEYEVRVEVSDNTGQQRTYAIPLKDLGPQKKIICMDSPWTRWFFGYDDQGRCNYLIGLNTSGDPYDCYIKGYWYEDGPHKGKMRRLEYSAGSLANLCYFDFRYDENGHLLDFGQWRVYPATSELKNYSTYTNIKYRENGTISSYTCNGTVRDHVPFIAGFVPGEYIGAEDMRSTYRTSQPVSDRRMISGLLPVENRGYMPGIPCIIDWQWCGTVAFYYLRTKYFFTNIISNTAAGSSGYSSPTPYTIDENGMMREYSGYPYYYEGEELPPHPYGRSTDTRIKYYDYDRSGKMVWSYEPLDYHWDHHADF